MSILWTEIPTVPDISSGSAQLHSEDCMLETMWCPQYRTDRQGQGLLAAGKTTGAAIGQNIVPKGSDGFPEAELGGPLQTFSSTCLLSACILSHAVRANEVLGRAYILGGWKTLKTIQLYLSTLNTHKYLVTFNKNVLVRVPCYLKCDD